MRRQTFKRIVITGATRGLGRAMAEKFIALGHAVCGCGRSRDTIKALHKSHGEPHDFDVVDVARDDQVRQWARRVLKAYGPPDLLINNAGLINANAPLWEVSAEEFGRVMDVNLKGVAHVIRHFVPGMIERGEGVIVNFSSTWGRSTAAEVAPYCASKWAVEGLTSALAQELPRGLAAVAFNPGVIDTDMLRICFGDHSGAYVKPADWAEQAVPFLLELGRRHNGRSVSSPE